MNSISEPTDVRMYLPEPLRAPREMIERLAGRTLPDEVFKLRPWGRRILVVRQEGPEEIGGIWLPDQAKEPLSVGWVVAVGPLVGTPHPEYGGWIGDPVDLLGRKVLFGKYAGQALLVGDRRETNYESLYTVLSDVDVWGDLDE